MSALPHNESHDAANHSTVNTGTANNAADPGRKAYVLGLMSCAPLLVGAFVLAEAGSKAQELDKDYVTKRNVTRQVEQGLEAAPSTGQAILIVDFDQAARDADNHVSRLESIGFSAETPRNVGVGLLALGGLGLLAAGLGRPRP